MTEQDRIRAALAELGTVLSDIAVTAEQKSQERCPYKTQAELCTFRGGCQSQVRSRGVVAIGCGGDHLILREPYEQP